MREHFTHAIPTGLRCPYGPWVPVRKRCPPPGTCSPSGPQEVTTQQSNLCSEQPAPPKMQPQFPTPLPGKGAPRRSPCLSGPTREHSACGKQSWAGISPGDRDRNVGASKEVERQTDPRGWGTWSHLDRHPPQTSPYPHTVQRPSQPSCKVLLSVESCPQATEAEPRTKVTSG